jgi:hypothetical protein
MKTFFGKYRGKVEQNKDPEGLGRLLVSCPSVMGEATNWAMPSVPYAGKSVGWFALPPVKANVWVEFEEGNIDYPIWAGCFWDKGEVPAKPAIPELKVWQTEHATLTLDDRSKAGGATLRLKSPAVSVPITISATSDGVTIKLANTTLALTKSAVEIKLPPGELKFASGGATLKHGKAEISLQGLKVAINKGALEIT